MTNPIRIGIVGVGKIAVDQHLPAIAASDAFRLTAAASRNARVEGVGNHATIEELLAADEVDAVALCQPPQARYPAARAAIAAGKHVLLEKPPGATLAEVEQLRELAAEAGVTLFASWHARFAPGVEPARRWLEGRRVAAVRIDWREDIRHWHPGQDWILSAGGLGVFDPGINALSIATAILPPFHLRGAKLDFPEGRQGPIAAELDYGTDAGAAIAVGLDFLQTGPQTWDIMVETDGGTLLLSGGGSKLTVDGVAQPVPGLGEYPVLYKHFAKLIRAGASDVDVAPLRHVADAFMAGERRTVATFAW